MKAIYPFVGGTATSQKYNLKNPNTFTGTFVGGWTHSSTGATPNGVNAYMDTGFIKSTNLSDTSKHLSFYSRTQDSSKSAHDIGAEGITSGANFDLFLYYAGVSNKGYIDGDYPTNAVQSNNTNTLGFQIGSRTVNNVQKLYWNNSLLSTNTTTKTVAQTSINIYLGSTNRGTATAFSNKQCAFASIGDGLTDTDASNLYTAVQAFQTTLGRQV